MRNIRPIFLMHEEGIGTLVDVVIFGVQTVLQFAGVGKEIDVNYFGVWRDSPIYYGKRLVPYKSIDWYIHTGRQSARPSQLNVDVIMANLEQEPWQKTSPHYDVVILSNDIYSEGTNFVIGLATYSIGTIISVHRFMELDQKLRAECVKTEVMHELAHVFGVVPDERTNNIEESLGKHCTNTCVMRQGLQVPRDWIRMTQDRLRVGPFCKDCASDLRNYFR